MYPIAEGACTASALLALPGGLVEFVAPVSSSAISRDRLHPKHFRQRDPHRRWR
jgi:hypothetical protein